MLAAMLSLAVVSAEAQILADDGIHTVGPPTGSKKWLRSCIAHYFGIF